MVSQFSLSFLFGLIVSFLLVRLVSRGLPANGRETLPSRAATAVVQPITLSRHKQIALVSIFLAGAIVWSLHLMIGYAIASMGCTYRLNQMTLLGVPAIHGLIGLITLPAVLGSAYAGVLGYREWQSMEREHSKGLGYARFLGLGGALLNGLFTALILFEAAPALVLRACG